MKKIKTILLMVMSILLVSCSAQKHLVRIGHSPEFRMEWYTPIRNYTVLQIQDPNFFLAVDDASVRPSVIAVSISNELGPVYEGQKLHGIYVMIDTYTYETRSNETKTVPLVMPIKDYENLKYEEKMLKKEEKRR